MPRRIQLALLALLLALLPQQGSADADALVLLPQVALLFLAPENAIVYEDAWRAFLRLAGQAGPVTTLPEEALDLHGEANLPQLFPPLTTTAAAAAAAKKGLSRSPADAASTVSSGESQQQDKGQALLKLGFDWELGYLDADITALAACRVQGCSGPGLGAIGEQELFSVYTHPQPGYRFPATSLFAGTEVPNRVDLTAGGGQHAHVKAVLRLMEAALLEPRNQRFVVASAASMPLYPPQVLWVQLMVEEKSRINACPDTSEAAGRTGWPEAMATPYLRKEHLARSPLWMVLSRDLAALAVADRHVEHQFAAHCRESDEQQAAGGGCSSTEQFFPTLIAAYGLSNKTDCYSQAHFMGMDPLASLSEFQLIQFVLLDHMRHKEDPGCDVDSAMAMSAKLLASPNPWLSGGHHRHRHQHRHQHRRLSHQQQGRQYDDDDDVGMADDSSSSSGDNRSDRFTAAMKGWATAAGYVPLHNRCPLLASHFPVQSQEQALRMALSCAGIGLLPLCRHNEPLSHTLW